jgi:hypothetical protein
MVSSITKLVLIGAGLAIAAGLAYFTYQYTFSDTLGGQLARSRLGIDKPPPLSTLLNERADPSKPTSQQPKSRVQEFIEELYYNTTGERLNLTSTHSNAAFYHHDLSIEEEKYEEPLALER